MLPFVWFLQSIPICASMPASIEWYGGYGRNQKSLVTMGVFMTSRGYASGLVHEISAKNHYNLSNRVTDWIAISGCPPVTSIEKTAVFISTALENAVHVGASALLLLCLNISPDLVEQVRREHTEENMVPVVAVDTVENISAVLKLMEQNSVVKAKITDLSRGLSNKAATVSVWTACSRTRSPLSTRPDGVFCAGMPSTKDSVVAVWNASTLAVLSILLVLLLKLKQFFQNFEVIQLVPEQFQLFGHSKPPLYNAAVIEKCLPSKAATCQEISSMCPICLDIIDNCQRIRALPCRHYFHLFCIDEWLVIVPSCPMCKRKAFPDDF